MADKEKGKERDLEKKAKGGEGAPGRPSAKGEAPKGGGKPAGPGKGKPEKGGPGKAPKGGEGEGDAGKKKVHVEEKGPPPRLLVRYRQEIVPALQQRFGHSNPLAVARITKVVVSMGVGKAIENKKRLEAAVQDLATITGQRPLVTRAKHSISAFKLREGMEIGCKVTLRRARMWEFLDRLLSVAIPRLRDFRGLPRRGFDGRGNYSFGISEQISFPEITIDRMEFPQGMNVHVVTTARGDREAEALLELLGVPFVSAEAEAQRARA